MSMKKIQLDKENCKSLYRSLGSWKSVASYLGISYETLRRNLRVWGISNVVRYDFTDLGVTVES
jgi:transcriptional regulator with AAA-type ATPase domain